ncbi:hypothetical protein Tco_0282950 [Tanacetum coccineum]
MEKKDTLSSCSETKDVHAIKYKMSKAKERCMAYFRSLHSHLQVLSKDYLKGTRIEYGFKRAFMSLLGQDVDTFTSTMLLNVDQLQKQLDKDEFQEDGSMAAFWVVQHFRDTLLQHLGNVKKSVAERTRHQRKYERRVNKRQMQTQKSKIDTGKALDADLVDTESIRTDSTVQDDSSRSGNDTDADDADIRPIYDEEPMAEVQLTAECNIFAIGLLHMEQPESLLRENNLLDLILGGNLQVEFSNLLVLDIPHIMNPNNSDVSEGTSINDQEGTRLVLSAGGSLLQPPITKTKSAQIESRARRDHSINLIRTQCQNTLGGHHKVHRSYALSWKPCQGDSLNLPDHSGITPSIKEPINVYCDNSAAITFANDSGIMKGARHFLRRYHYVREQVKSGEIKVLKVHTDDNLADPFTKALPRGKVTDHANGIGLQLASSFMHTCD